MTQGSKSDSGKAMFSLFPARALWEVAEVLTHGAREPGRAPDNWKLVRDAKRRYLDAGFRHMYRYLGGSDIDPQYGKHHLAHAICSLLFVLAFELGEQTVEERELAQCKST